MQGVEITAVANSTRASAEAFARDWASEATLFDDWRTLVESADCDIIWIGAHPVPALRRHLRGTRGRSTCILPGPHGAGSRRGKENDDGGGKAPRSGDPRCVRRQWE